MDISVLETSLDLPEKYRAGSSLLKSLVIPVGSVCNLNFWIFSKSTILTVENRSLSQCNLCLPTLPIS